MTEIRRAMLFAAGLGTRMRPHTDHTPKPLLRVAGKPMLDYALDRFEAAGCERVVINSHYLSEQVASHVRARSAQSDQLELCLSHEDTLLETGGGIVKALPLLGDQAFF